MTVADTLAYYVTATITAVKGFIVTGPQGNVTSQNNTLQNEALENDTSQNDALQNDTRQS